MSDMDPRHTDKRTADRYIRMGELDEKTYEKWVKALPDVAAKAISVESSMLDDEDDLDDDTED